MDENTSLDKTKRQTINPLVDVINKQVEPLLKDAMLEFGEPLSLSFRLYNQIRFYEEYGKLAAKVSVAGKETLAEQFGVTVKQIEGAYNNLTNIKKLGKWVEHHEPVFRNVRRTWMSNVRLEKDMNSNGIRVELLSDKSRTLMGLELPSDEPPLSESKKKVSESKILLFNNNNMAKAVSYGDTNINDIFEYWNVTVGYPITGRLKLNRYAASNLIKKHGLEGVKQLVNGVATAQHDQFAPRITDFISLQAKMNDLLSWGNRVNNTSKGIRKI